MTSSSSTSTVPPGRTTFWLTRVLMTSRPLIPNWASLVFETLQIVAIILHLGLGSTKRRFSSLDIQFVFAFVEYGQHIALGDFTPTLTFTF
jgi:hypothetical protein